MYSLYFTSYALIHCGKYEAANAQLDELIPLATEKNAAQWRGGGMMHRGCIQALTGKPSDAITMIPAAAAGRMAEPTGRANARPMTGSATPIN